MYTREEVESAIKQSWASTTSRNHQWRPENPESGQSDVSALALHDYLGGTIVRRLVYLPGGENAYHYRNIIDGEPVDLTAGQYPENAIFDENEEPVDREQFDERHPVNIRLETLKNYMRLYLPDRR